MKKLIGINSIIILALIIAGVYYISIYNNISENIIRFHVISNSNSPLDTNIKLGVRDSVLASLKGDFTKNSGKQDILSKLPEIELLANEYLKKTNAGYGAKVVFENTEIPRKEYNGIVLPQGNYRAIRVILGEGAGENWWCVAYPPLCFTEGTFGNMSKEGFDTLRNSLDNESYRIITSEINYEFKILEIAEKIAQAIKSH